MIKFFNMKKKLSSLVLFAALTILTVVEVNVNNVSGLSFALKNMEALATDEYNEDDFYASKLICPHCDVEVDGCIACVEDGCHCSVPVHDCQ